MSAQEMVTVDEARHALRAYEVTDNSSTGAANAYRTVIALHARVAELESHRDHYTREAARLVAVEAERNTLRAERDAAVAKVAELEAHFHQLVASQQTRTMIGNCCGVCGRMWRQHAPGCWVGDAVAVLDEVTP